jgi:hypothetical protein
VAQVVNTRDARPGGHGFEPSDLPILFKTPFCLQLSAFGKTSPSTSSIDTAVEIVHPRLSEFTI